MQHQTLDFCWIPIFVWNATNEMVIAVAVNTWGNYYDSFHRKHVLDWSALIWPKILAWSAILNFNFYAKHFGLRSSI